MSSITKILTSEAGGGSSRLERKKMKKSLLLYSVTLFIVTLLIAGLVVYFVKPEWLPFTGSSNTTEQTTKPAVSTKASKYVAVFLTNNQVYFGKLGSLDGQYATLSEVYYLRVQRSLSEGLDASSVNVEGKGQAAAAGKNDLTLIKLGDELHGPTDEIKLNRDHILLIEDLKEDSKVVKAIEEFKAKK